MTQPADGAPSGAPADLSPSGGTAPAEGAGDTGAEGAQSGAGTAEKTPAQTVSKADFERAVNQLRAADKRREEAEQQLRQIRDKDLPEAEKLKRDFTEVSARVTDLESSLKKTRIENAFLKANKFKWQDPEVALAVADMSAVTIDDEGHVTGLEAALERLAKSKPWMLDKSGESSDDGASAPAGPTGTPPMNGQPSSGRPDRAAMVKRFPALRTRQRPS